MRPKKDYKFPRLELERELRYIEKNSRVDAVFGSIGFVKSAWRSMPWNVHMYYMCK